MDSCYLSHVLQQLHATGGARLVLGAEDLVSGEQSTCDETMKSLGVTDGTILELMGSTLSETDAITIEPPKLPVSPTPDQFCTLPSGTGFCCSKICACGRSSQGASVPPVVLAEELAPPTVVV